VDEKYTAKRACASSKRGPPFVVASVIFRHRERSAAICLSALFSHLERSEGSFCFPVLAW